MIDIKVIRENPEKFKKAAIDKKMPDVIDRLLDLDDALRKDKAFLQDILRRIELANLFPNLAIPKNKKP